MSQFKICIHELGDTALTDVELSRIAEALRSEAERLRNISATFEYAPVQPAA